MKVSAKLRFENLVRSHGLPIGETEFPRQQHSQSGATVLRSKGNLRMFECEVEEDEKFAHDSGESDFGGFSGSA